MGRNHGRPLSHARRAEYARAWMIMLPSLLLMTFFVWEPLFESVRMSLYKTRNVELVRFIWFDNYLSVMKKDDFLQALMNTFSYTFWSLLIGFLLPIGLAILIGETRRGKGFFRTVAYLPNMLPGLAVVILWSSFFSGGRNRRTEHPSQRPEHSPADLPDEGGMGHPHHHRHRHLEGGGRNGADLHGQHCWHQP